MRSLMNFIIHRGLILRSLVYGHEEAGGRPGPL
jgi:hypothetical protein